MYHQNNNNTSNNMNKALDQAPLPFTNIVLNGDFLEYSSQEGVRYIIDIDREAVCADFSETDYDSETGRMETIPADIRDITPAQWCAVIISNIETATICDNWLASINEADFYEKWNVCFWAWTVAGKAREIATGNERKRLWDVETGWMHRSHELFQVVKKLQIWTNPF